MLNIPWLENTNDQFPEVELALTDPDGLLAIGGELSEARLISAYRRGIFPWYEDDQPVLWWSPNPRCVLYPDQIHVSRSLKKTLQKTQLKVTFDAAFSEVITHCANLRVDQQGTWITSDIMTAFQHLHELGIAHSVEVWEMEGQKRQLVGGLYGIAMGKVFFGESMFSRRSDASKIALYHLCLRLQAWGFNLIDCQVHSDHLQSLGTTMIARREFINHLTASITNPYHSNWNRSP